MLKEIVKSLEVPLGINIIERTKIQLRLVISLLSLVKIDVVEALRGSLRLPRGNGLLRDQ